MGIWGRTGEVWALARRASTGDEAERDRASR